MRENVKNKRWWLFAAISLGVLFLLTLSMLFGCKNQTQNTGGEIKKTIKSDSSVTLGSTSKYGWELLLEEGTFEDEVQLTMTMLSPGETEDYQSDDFTLYGTPVKIKVDGKENIRLGEPVIVRMQIPQEDLEDIKAEELFFGYYYDGKWEYAMPDLINVKEGIAYFSAYHFSYFGFGRPSEAEQISAFAKSFAALQWENEQKACKIKDALSRQYDDLFSSMGIGSSSVRNQLTADVISYLESAINDSDGVAPIDALAQMASSASKGKEGMQDFQNKLLEFTGKGLSSCLEKIRNAPGKYTEKFATQVNVLGNLGSALGYLSTGDKEGALESIGNMLKGLDPMGALANSALDYIKESAEEVIEYWTQSELEKAYQVYTTGVGGKWGYTEGLQGDFNTIFTLLGGADRQMNIKIIRHYCNKYGLKEGELTLAERDRIISNAKTALKRNFDQRKVSEAAIEMKIKKEESFIYELKKVGLLSASGYNKYFGIDANLRNFSISERLARLYKIKATVLASMDKEVAENLSDEFLARVMEQWIYWHEKGQISEYFNYLKEMGYLSEPIKLDPTFAWVLVEVVDFDNAESWISLNSHVSYDYEYSYSQGAYGAKIIYTGDTDEYWFNPPKYNGEALGAMATYGAVPKIIQPDQPVSLTLALSATENTQSFFTFSAWAGADFDQPDVAPGGVTRSAISFKNSDNKDSFTLSNDDSYASINETLEAKLPVGSEGKRIALRTKFYMGASMGTNYIYEWKQVE